MYETCWPPQAGLKRPADHSDHPRMPDDAELAHSETRAPELWLVDAASSSLGAELVEQARVHRVVRLDDVPERLEADAAVVVIVGTSEGTSAAEYMRALRDRGPSVEVIAVADEPSVDGAVEWMRAGAFDYVRRDSGRLRDAARGALQRASARGPAPGRAQPHILERIVACSAGMRRLVATVRDLAVSESSVLIEAESGTGKELVARALHDTSTRAGGAFVAVDCGALPDGIVEAELFGHQRGAFTGAERASPGLFRSAHGGTLFLDEIGELPIAAQAKLLRAIQEREVRPLGASRPQPVDVRIVAATHRDLADDVRTGRFRADLFYRLRVVALSIPPLRERPEDIPVLAARFLARAAGNGRVHGFEADVIDALLAHDWPGNVRELENAIEGAAALARGSRIGAADLRLGGGAGARAPAPDDIPLALEAYEAACLGAALRHCGGDVSRTARLLGIGRSTLYRKLARHGLSR